MGNRTCIVVSSSENLSSEETEEKLEKLDKTLTTQCQGGVVKLGDHFILPPQVWVFSREKLRDAKTLIANHGFSIVSEEKP